MEAGSGSTKANHTKHLLGVIRHGERADYAVAAEDKYNFQLDPLLTEKGGVQAQETGAFLRSYLE